MIHVGYAGGLQPDMKAGDIVLTDGAYNAIAKVLCLKRTIIIMRSENKTDR